MWTSDTTRGFFCRCNHLTSFVLVRHVLVSEYAVASSSRDDVFAQAGTDFDSLRSLRFTGANDKSTMLFSLLLYSLTLIAALALWLDEGQRVITKTITRQYYQMISRAVRLTLACRLLSLVYHQLPSLAQIAVLLSVLSRFWIFSSFVNLNLAVLLNLRFGNVANRDSIAGNLTSNFSFLTETVV